MKIGLLGGSFDPPHIGHCLVAKQVKEVLKIDEVWFVPCAVHAFNKEMSAAVTRFAMAKTYEEDGILASDFEIKKGGVSYTIETLEELEKARPSDTFYWIASSEQLSCFQKYREWKKIIKDHNLVIFPRRIALLDLKVLTTQCLNLKKIPSNITLLNSKDLIEINISSTAIRERIKNNLSISYLVSKGTEKIIREKSLYKISY